MGKPEIKCIGECQHDYEVRPGIKKEPPSYLPQISEASRSTLTQLFSDAIRYRQIRMAEAVGDRSEIQKLRDAIRIDVDGNLPLPEPTRSADQAGLYRHLAHELGITLPQ